ncbi:MAG TPA: hypothetical protein HPP66_11070 [Planctomycetes bacterium]|nr:hypothetical protein [Planctomycetota bacterium]
MALKKCKECGQEISTKSERCPHCGAPTARGVGVVGRFLLIILLAIVIFIALACIGII